MLEQEFKRLYRKFRLWHYRTIFAQVGERSGSLTATEALSAEVIFLLDPAHGEGVRRVSPHLPAQRHL